MEPSTSDSSATTTQRTTPGTDRLSNLEEMGPTSTNQSSTEQQQHSAGTSSTTGSFECNICLDTAHDAVVSMCGHLFCWPCLHQWLETSRAQLVCPVCKAAISVDKVIPIYGRGGDHTRDPRSKVPPRPTGHRVEPDQNGSGGQGGLMSGLFGNMEFFGGSHLQMSIGLGAFPLSIFQTAFHAGARNADGGTGGSAGTNNRSGRSAASLNTENEFISKVFLCVAIFFIFWLLIA